MKFTFEDSKGTFINKYRNTVVKFITFSSLSVQGKYALKLSFKSKSSVELYEDNALKLETVS